MDHAEHRELCSEHRDSGGVGVGPAGDDEQEPDAEAQRQGSRGRDLPVGVELPDRDLVKVDDEHDDVDDDEGGRVGCRRELRLVPHQRQQKVGQAEDDDDLGKESRGNKEAKRSLRKEEACTTTAEPDACLCRCLMKAQGPVATGRRKEKERHMEGSPGRTFCRNSVGSCNRRRPRTMAILATSSVVERSPGSPGFCCCRPSVQGETASKHNETGSRLSLKSSSLPKDAYYKLLLAATFESP